MHYPGAINVVNEILFAYRSFKKDFRSDISLARVQSEIASLVAELKKYTGKNPNNLPGNYESVISQFSNKINLLMERIQENTDNKKVLEYLSRGNSILNETNVMIGRALYADKEPPLENICHNLDAAYNNLRMAMEL